MISSSRRFALPIASALRRALHHKYGAAEFRADLLGGVVVGIVALPLSMALAIAVGVPPQHGLYTAIVAGCATALFGGCKFQITGPTAAFIVILAPIVQRHGISGLLTAGLLAGLMLVLLGVTRMGSLIKFVPYPVTTGFTTGIATVIATLQIKDVLGLDIDEMPEAYHEKLIALWEARASFNPLELLVATVTLLLLLGIPRVIRSVPAPLLAIGTVTLGVATLRPLLPEDAVATIGTRFHTVVDGVAVPGIPSTLPVPSLPWAELDLDFETLRALLPAAFAIALLGAIESLLSAVIADGMTGTRHDPDAELVGQGIGNMLCPFFGGIPATGALARTATNIRAGARSPIAGVMHALVVLLAMLLMAPWVAHIPMASLSALLLLVAWNMSELKHFTRLIRVAPRSDVVVLLMCFLLTVIFDMVWAVSVGFVLASLLFIRRMASLSGGGFAADAPREEKALPDLPAGVAMYEVNGPLFFGAAQNAMDALHAAHGDAFHTLILHLGRVTVIDATGFAALENTLHMLHSRGKRVVLAGPLPTPESIWDKADKAGLLKDVTIASDLTAALALVRRASLTAPPAAQGCAY
jgi:SulP family sulfate permease